MRLILVVLFAAGLLGQAFAGPWPGDRKAAVVLTYDDALPSHLDTAIPALDAAGLKGTFFLIGSGIRKEHIARWRAAAADGHELGNHTIFHACLAATYPAPPRYTAETYTVDTMLKEIATMNTMLTAIDGKDQHSYAMPCGNRLAGGEDYVGPLGKAGLVRYARGCNYPGGTIDPMEVPSQWFAETATGADLIAAVKRVEQSGGLLVVGFHGVGGDYLTVPAKSHAELLDYLKARQDTIWTTTFSEAMDALTPATPLSP